MAQVTIAVEEASDYYATWSHVFQGANTSWLGFDTRQIFGNFFIGLQGQTENAWNTQIPPGSTILSATMEFTGFQNGMGLFGGLYRTTMSSPDRALQTQQQDPIQQPFAPFEGWRHDQWSNAEVIVLSTTFTTIAAPATAAANQSTTLRQLTVPGAASPQRDLLGQRITAAAGNTTIASITWTLRRSPVSPAGDVRVRIQGVTVDRGITIPDGVDIAVSNPIPMSGLSTIGAGAGAVFTFALNPTLVPGQQYFLILDPDDYPANNVNWIQSRQYNAFLTNGQLYHFGEGLAFDWQNYPGVVDLNQAVVLAAEDIIPGGIQWPVGNVFVNVLEISPDISALIQAQVDMPNYTADSGIIITLSRGSASALGRVMRSNFNVPGPGPVLRITYDEPEPVVDDFSRGVRPQADQRILAADDDTAVLLAHAFMEMRKRWH